jgi:hypothetical protein
VYADTGVRVSISQRLMRNYCGGFRRQETKIASIAVMIRECCKNWLDRGSGFMGIIDAGCTRYKAEIKVGGL